MHSATVSAKGARRWEAGHPWIYRSDLVTAPYADAGVVRVMDQRGKPIGVALWSPRSEISLRLLDSDPDASIDGEWWHRALARAIARRRRSHPVADRRSLRPVDRRSTDERGSRTIPRRDRPCVDRARQPRWHSR